MKSFLILCCLIGVSLATRPTNDNDEPEVTTNSGRILGSILQSRLGRRIYSFRGVRYANPPVGQQRFQPPTMVTPWEGVFNATVDGPRCPGVDKNFVSEDCLLLNVYSTKLPSLHAKSRPVKRPVLIFFHPGGFYGYTGRSDIFGPQYLMDKDIVLVTVNYRLATLGYIATGDSLAPGNLGFKDQVIAMRWVQQNIHAFGGDPDCVTISGCSAGSMSVLLHMVSPMSGGLFHRAIAMSAGIPSLYPLPGHQKHLAYKQAELLGCPTDTTGAMMLCLNSKPVENFTDTVTQFFEWGGFPILVWSPVVEPDVPGLERFMPAQPYDLIRQGKIHQVPLLAGITTDEFAVIVVDLEKLVRVGNFSAFDDLNNKWQTLMPITHMYERGTPRSLEISSELRRFYFNNEDLSPAKYPEIGALFADSVITFGVHRTIGTYADYMHEPVYYYKFTFQGRKSFSMWNDTTPYGVVHHDDLQYLFYMGWIFPDLHPGDPEVPMVELMTTMWSNFMVTGEPVPRHNPSFANITWERYSTERDNYMNIKLEPKMEYGLYTERMREWERLFPLFSVAPVKH